MRKGIKHGSPTGEKEPQCVRVTRRHATLLWSAERLDCPHQPAGPPRVSGTGQRGQRAAMPSIGKGAPHCGHITPSASAMGSASFKGDRDFRDVVSTRVCSLLFSVIVRIVAETRRVQAGHNSTLFLRRGSRGGIGHGANVRRGRSGRSRSLRSSDTSGLAKAYHDRSVPLRPSRFC